MLTLLGVQFHSGPLAKARGWARRECGSEIRRNADSSSEQQLPGLRQQEPVETHGRPEDQLGRYAVDWLTTRARPRPRTGLGVCFADPHMGLQIRYELVGSELA